MLAGELNPKEDIFDSQYFLFGVWLGSVLMVNLYSNFFYSYLISILIIHKLKWSFPKKLSFIYNSIILTSPKTYFDKLRSRLCSFLRLGAICWIIYWTASSVKLLQLTIFVLIYFKLIIRPYLVKSSANRFISWRPVPIWFESSFTDTSEIFLQLIKREHI